jgi:DNA polymerase elongation subunit (family B)
MKFYTNVVARGDKIYVRGFEKGKRVEFIEKYRPYLFLPKKDGFYRTLDGQQVDKMQFDSIRDARDFVARYKDVDNFKYYGLDNYQYVFMYDYYNGEIDYDPSIVSVVTLDLECASDEGFPDISLANKEITAITLRKNGKSLVVGCGEFVTDDPNVYYKRCADEKDLLKSFLNMWEKLKPDIITGWNVEMFDIPYLANRIKNLLGEEYVKQMSPWRIVNRREIIRGKSVNRGGKQIESRMDEVFDIFGVSVLDYLQLYKKFKFGNQESYKLDYIAQVELGEKKIDYSEYGNLLDLYKNNYQKFIEYNIHDCVLVERLEEKLKFIEQVMALAYDAKVNYNDTMTTVRPWDVIIHNYLLDRRIVIPQFNKKLMPDHLIGGYVKEPKIGMSKWVVSFDLNSLYPHLIMQYNISPETYAGRSGKFPSIEDIIEQEDINYRKGDGQTEYAITANGCYYRKDKQGFLPALMEKMYDDRVEYKKKMIEAKKKYEQTKKREDEMLIARYHNMQLAKKIQLNSAYGALGNEYFRWFSFDNAEAITTSGQLSIRWIEKKMNEFMNRVCKTQNVDYVIASDTDSIYVTFERLIPSDCDELKAVKLLDEFCETKVQSWINTCYDQLAGKMNAYQQKMQMKRETIANKGIWRGKKMYILNAWNVEGVQYDEPKLKIQGIEAVRSSTPHVCREKIKESLKIIMNQDEKTLQKYVAEFKNDFMNMSFESIAFPRGVKLSHYVRAENGGTFKVPYKLEDKGLPIHVKGALLYNKYRSRNTQLPPIQDGDKIKFAYLKQPNPIGEHVIAALSELPPEFNLDKYIDKSMQFSKTFLEPLSSIATVIGWEVEKQASLEEFFT